METPVDPRHEQLIALLYGELSPQEAEGVRTMIEEDPSLRSEWEGLLAARESLAGWEGEEQAPRFVFLRESEDEEDPEGPLGSWGSVRERFRRALVMAPWVVAATAVVVAVLFAADLRVERGDGAIAFRFGAPQDAIKAEPVEPSGLPVYATREDLVLLADDMTRAMALLLNVYSRQRDREVDYLLRTAVGRIMDQQDTDYRNTMARVDALGQNIAEESYKTNFQINYLLSRTESGQGMPGTSPLEGGTEGVER